MKLRCTYARNDSLCILTTRALNAVSPAYFANQTARPGEVNLPARSGALVMLGCLALEKSKSTIGSIKQRGPACRPGWRHRVAAAHLTTEYRPGTIKHRHKAIVRYHFGMANDMLDVNHKPLLAAYPCATLCLFLFPLLFRTSTKKVPLSIWVILWKDEQCTEEQYMHYRMWN